MALTKQERIDLILRRLAASMTPGSVEEAIELLKRVINAIEDEHSGIGYSENPGKQYIGRMYGPRDDSIRNVSGGVLARTRGTYVYIWNDGGFVILSLNGTVQVANLQPVIH